MVNSKSENEQNEYTIVDGFKFPAIPFTGTPEEKYFSSWPMSKIIQVEADKLDQYVDYINEKKIKHIDIRPENYKRKEDIDFIRRCPDVEEFGSTTPFIKDYSPLYDLKHLRALS
jgi:hypothetical protein